MFFFKSWDRIIKQHPSLAHGEINYEYIGHLTVREEQRRKKRDKSRERHRDRRRSSSRQCFVDPDLKIPIEMFLNLYFSYKAVLFVNTAAINTD